MPNVRITRGISANSALGRQIEAEVARKTAARLESIAAEAVVQTQAIVTDDLVTDRSGDRHRPGAHLINSFRCKVVWNGHGFPIKLVMTSIAPGRVVNTQESGAGAHKISGPSVFPVAQRWGGKGPQSSTPRAAAYLKNKAGRPTVRATNIDHPGNKAIHMMQKGLERAVEAAYNQAVHARRR